MKGTRQQPWKERWGWRPAPGPSGHCKDFAFMLKWEAQRVCDRAVTSDEAVLESLSVEN